MFLSTLNYRYPELQTIVEHVHNVLGTDCELYRQYVTMWHNWNHPAPFQNEESANSMLELTSLLDCIELSSWPEPSSGDASEARDQGKITCLVEAGPKIVSLVQQIVTSIHPSSYTGMSYDY